MILMSSSISYLIVLLSFQQWVKQVGYIINNKMEQLSQLQAHSAQKIHTIATIASYSLLKILLNKDYLAKNQLGDKYLLCLSKTRHECSPQQLTNTHIICSIDTLTEEAQRYEVFPLEKKLFWAGEAAYLQEKSELYCLSVLYSALKYIVKPLLSVSGANQLAKCICLQNLWFRGSSAFLFLCNRHKDRLSLKTEMRNKKTINQFEIQQEMLQRTGQIFWDIFCADNNPSQNNSRTAFRQIVKMMVKGQTSLSELQQIMEDKLAKRKFMSSLTKKYTIDTEELLKNKETIDENVLSKLDNIPVKAGKIYHGLHFDRRKSLQPTQQNHRYPKLNSLCQEDELIPPSFTHSKRKKRFSLFSGNKMPYRTSSIGGKDSQRITVSIQRNEVRNQNMERQNKQEMDLKYSLDINGAMRKWKDGKSPGSKPKSIERRRELKRFFDQVKITQNRVHSRLDVMNEHSKEKALAVFKKSIDCDTMSEDKLIDDKIFVANLRVKRNQYKQNLQKSIVKVCEYMNMKPAAKQQNQPVNEVSQQNNQNVRQSKAVNNPGKLQNGKNRLTQQLVSNLVKQQIVSTTPKLQVSQRQSIQSGILEQRIFNEAVIAEQKAAMSIINEREVIDFSLENKKEQKESQKGKNKVSIEQSIVEQESSTNAAQQKIRKQTSIRQPDPSSVETKQQHFPRYESQVELLSLSKINETSQIQPSKIATPKYDQSQKQALIIPRSLASKIVNKTEQTIKTPSKQEARDRPEIKEREIEEQTRQNFSFAAVTDAKINEIQEIKSFISPNNKKPTAMQGVAKSEKEIKVQKIAKKEPKSVKNINPVLEDEIEEINLVSNIVKKAPNPSKEETKQIRPKHENNPQPEIKPSAQGKPTIQPKEPAAQTPVNKPKARKRSSESEKQQEEAQVQKDEKQKTKKPERLKTGQSNASSNGNRPIKKQIEEYIFMINKMGEAVAKTSKLNKKLQKIEWFTGVYYLYKRFFFERKKIEKYLTNDEPKLTRYTPFSEEEWNEWLKKGEKEAMLIKCIEDNANIEKSIKKMMKKLQSQQLPATILLNAALNKNIEDSSRIAVQYVVDEYDQLEQQGLLKDPQLLVHVCQIVNALYVMAEIDGKVKQKRPVLDYSNTKRSKEELSQMVQVIFDLYQQQ